jgi:hypothetical protein
VEQFSNNAGPLGAAMQRARTGSQEISEHLRILQRARRSGNTGKARKCPGSVVGSPARQTTRVRVRQTTRVRVSRR